MHLPHRKITKSMNISFLSMINKVLVIDSHTFYVNALLKIFMMHDSDFGNLYM